MLASLKLEEPKDYTVEELAEHLGLSISETTELIRTHIVSTMEDLDDLNYKLDYVRNTYRQKGIVIYGSRITNFPKILGCRGNGSAVFIDQKGVM